MAATALDISTSALIAQRQRLNAISSNIANISTLRDADGNVAPYQTRHVIFQADENLATSDGALGVKVSEVQTNQEEPHWRHQPDHPLAIQSGPRKGYVAYPAVSLNTQFVDALEATRAYEANVGVIEVSKQLSQQALRILG